MKFFAFTSILLVCFQNAFSQTTLLQIKFENKENFILERDKKIIALKCDDTYIHKKLKENYSDDELLKEINKSIKEKLFTKYPENGLKAMTIIDFADKFAKKAISVIKPIPGDIQEELQLSNRYSVVHIPTRDVGQLYSFRDADPNGSLPTFIYYKTKEGYFFDITSINNSKDKDSIIQCFSEIYRFIQKNKEIKLPNITLIDEGSSQKIKIQYESKDENISISKAIFDKIKGDQLSTEEGTTVYKIKAVTPKEAEEAKETKIKKEEKKNEKIGKHNIELPTKRIYSLELLKKEEEYHLEITGALIEKDASNLQKEIVKEVNKTITSDNKIYTLSDNQDKFAILFNEITQKINQFTNTTDASYKTELEKAFIYFKGEIEKKEIIDKKNKEISDIIKQSGIDAIAAEVETKTKTGTLSLKNTNIKIYKETGHSTESAKIDSITFLIERGKFSRRLFYVFTDKRKIFINGQAPMPVHKVNIKRNNNKLYNINGDKEYVFIGDVIQYDPENGYFPDNTDKIVLSKNSKSMDLFAMSNLNSLVNFSVYTDLTGLLGRRANGLVITDVIGRFITNAGNISNRDLSPISFIDGHLTLSKFDSKFRSLDSNSVRVKNGSDLDTVDRMHLLQTAWLKAGIKFNVLSAKTYTNQYFNLNIGARINIINADSFYRTQQDILLFEYYPELSYSVIRLKNFGMELSTKWILQRLADKEKFANQKWEWVFNPQIAFYYYPFNNPSSTIYIRFNYYANKIKDANNFYQLQFGWRTGLKLNAKK